MSAPMHGGTHPQAGTPPGRYTPWQVHPPPPWAGTPPGRYTPGQVLPPRAGTPPWQVPPPPVGTSSLAGTPHPGRYTPLRSACWDMVNKRAVGIPLECILVDIIIIVVIFFQLHTEPTQWGEEVSNRLWSGPPKVSSSENEATVSSTESESIHCQISAFTSKSHA